MIKSTSLATPRSRTWGSSDLYMLGAVVVWGINYTAVKYALRDFSPMAFNGVRFALATLVMSAIVAWRAMVSGEKELLQIPRRDWLPVILLGLGGHTIYQVLFINGVARTTPANSSLLMATSPIWVVLVGYILRVERVGRLMATGIVVSFVGIVVLIGGGGGKVSLGGATLLGDLLILACAIGWAGYTIASKPMLARFSPLKLTTFTMVAGTIPLLAWSVPDFLRQDWGVVTPLAWASLVFSALFAVVVGYLVWYTSVQRVGNARTSIYSNLTPVFAILFAWLTLGSGLTLLQLLGAAIVLSGLIITRQGRIR